MHRNLTLLCGFGKTGRRTTSLHLNSHIPKTVIRLILPFVVWIKRLVMLTTGRPKLADTVLELLAYLPLLPK